MDYVVGSVAALISGNVTPSRPKLIKRALTPTKHPQSPNVTPKSEFVDDRSIFLSPTLQKKKAIVKKSPKRIFQNPDIDTTLDEDNSNLTSPIVDKVKKHLNDKLETDNLQSAKMTNVKSHKNKQNKSKESKSPVQGLGENKVDTSKNNENPPFKNRKRQTAGESATEETNPVSETVSMSVCKENLRSPKKSPMKRKRSKSINEKIDQDEKENVKSVEDNDNLPDESFTPTKSTTNNKKKQKKLRKKSKSDQPKSSEPIVNQPKENIQSIEPVTDSKKKLKNKKIKTKAVILEEAATDKGDSVENSKNPIPHPKNKLKPKKKSKDSNLDEEPEIAVNPNAVTSQDTDSEHESDDDIDSEDENKEVLEEENSADAAVESSDDEEQKPKKKEEKPEQKESHVATEDEIKRTLFVGNVPFSKKCKKEMKKLFSKYGDIETVRIRTIPVKDARVTPKLAVIKNELHPDRTTVNVYVKYKHASSIDEALSANNTVLNDHHLRVSRSDTSGSEHDPKCAIFVGNIPFAMEDEALRAKFQGCGEIESVRIVRDRKSNAGKGFGYVNFASKDGVELALALTEEDLTIKNRIMRVKRCTHIQNNKKNMSNTGNRGKVSKFNSNRSDMSNARGNSGKVSNFNSNRPNMSNARGKVSNFNSNRPNTSNARGNRGNLSNMRGDGRHGSNMGKFGRNKPNEESGAFRRISNKRKFQDGGEGPANKVGRMDQPYREKKQKKEFVGMTGEKKKKHKFNKGQKKKKALSEILNK